MPSDITPTITLNSSAGSVTFEHEHSAYPFVGRKITREYQDRKTRPSSEGPGKTVRVFRRYSGSEDSFSFTIPYLTATQVQILERMAEADPPSASMTFRGKSINVDIIDCETAENTWDKSSYRATLSILRSV